MLPTLHHKATVIVFLILMEIGFAVDAATMNGPVLDVPSGNLLLIKSASGTILGIRIRGIKLFPSDHRPSVARKRLHQLVAGRQVTVEYTEMGNSKWVPGRVSLGGSDIGLRLIRDGIAVFFHEPGLSEADAEHYRSAEARARKYRLGQWQSAGNSLLR